MLTWDRLGIGVGDQENISWGWLVFAFGKCSNRSCWRQVQLESRQSPFPIPQTNAPPHLEASRSLGRGRCHGHPAKFAWNDTGQWLRSHKGKAECPGSGGWQSRRPAEGLGDNQATIQAAPFGEEKSDCDLLGWNQRNLFFIILLAVYLALSALLSIHYLIPNTQGSSIYVITKVPGPRGKVTSKVLFCLAHSQLLSPKSLTTGHPKHSVQQLAQVLLWVTIFSPRQLLSISEFSGGVLETTTGCVRFLWGDVITFSAWISGEFYARLEHCAVSMCVCSD